MSNSIIDRIKSQIDGKVGMQEIDNPEVIALCKAKVDSLSKEIGYHARLRLDSVKLVSVYEFSLELALRGRTLRQKLESGGGSRSLFSGTPKDVWTAIDAEKSGDFSIRVPGSTTEETCHKCNGKTVCVKCGGKTTTSCHECHGSKKCRQCGGTGLQKCPNCSGRGTVSRLKPGGNCSWCHGKGEVFESGSWRSCRHCGGKGQAGDVTYSVTCPTCGGDGKITCKLCGGGRVCTACKGTGTEQCTDCSGTGKCKECSATGKAKYTWWCNQKEGEAAAKVQVIDALNVSDKELAKIRDGCGYGNSNWGGGLGYMPNRSYFNLSIPVVEGEVDKELFDSGLSSKVVFDIYNSQRGQNADDVLTILKEKTIEQALKSVTKELGRDAKWRVVSLKYQVVKIPYCIECDFSDWGVHGTLYISNIYDDKVKAALAFNVDNVAAACKQHFDEREEERRRELAAEQEQARLRAEERRRQEREREEERRRELAAEQKRDLFKKCLQWDIYCAAFLFAILTMIGLPNMLWRAEIMVYLKITPSILAGVLAYMISGIAYIFVCDYACSSIYSGWLNWKLDSERTLLRLLWVLVPLALVQGLYAKIPQVASFLEPVKNWCAAISGTEWSYIAGVCALKVAIIWASRKWEWKFAVEKSVIVLLAVLALAFAIWPSHLPDGMALKSGMDQVLPYVALPIRFLGLAVYWPVCIALWALGFAGRMAVSLVLWIISLFM